MNFGVHITLDGYGGNPEKLNDKELILKILTELPAKLGMHTIFGPEVVECPEVSAKDSGGYSGFVMFSESHMSCHTFPWRRFVSIDLYTCGNELDKELVVGYLKEAFDLEDVELNYIKRGTKFPVHDLVEKKVPAMVEEK
jgi:S-adenosylmethionine decarboxylase